MHWFHFVKKVRRNVNKYIQICLDIYAFIHTFPGFNERWNMIYIKLLIFQKRRLGKWSETITVFINCSLCWSICFNSYYFAFFKWKKSKGLINSNVPSFEFSFSFLFHSFSFSVHMFEDLVFFGTEFDDSSKPLLNLFIYHPEVNIHVVL